MAYVVVENTPGYLPDSDDPFRGTFAECKQALKDAVESYCESLLEGYEVEGLQVEPLIYWDRDLSFAHVIDPSKLHDLGRCFSIDPVCWED